MSKFDEFPKYKEGSGAYSTNVQEKVDVPVDSDIQEVIDEATGVSSGDSSIIDSVKHVDANYLKELKDHAKLRQEQLLEEEENITGDEALKRIEEGGHNTIFK